MPCVFELGGKSANITFPDADLDRTIVSAVSGIFAAGGQTCIAGSASSSTITSTTREWPHLRGGYRQSD